MTKKALFWYLIYALMLTMHKKTGNLKQSGNNNSHSENNNADLKPVRLDKRLDFFQVITPQLYNLLQYPAGPMPDHSNSYKRAGLYRMKHAVGKCCICLLFFSSTYITYEKHKRGHKPRRTPPDRRYLLIIVCDIYCPTGFFRSSFE